MTLVRVTQLSNKETSLLKFAAESLRGDNLALEKIIQPRRALAVPGDKGKTLLPLIREFDQAAGTPVFIQVVPDFEAQVLANDIAFVLGGHHWQLEFVTESRTHVSPMAAGGMGVEIWTWQPKEKPPTALTTPEARGWAAGETLSKYLELLELDAPHFDCDPSQPTNFDTAPLGAAAPLAFGPPRDAVVVYIGMKPVSWMVFKAQHPLDEK